ncbi:glycosyltransferase [Duganella sp. FT134W]|uniref:Glycosyltransferase n=1 Tax=Duganella margarita TaxID=2692170 RepID=A0A7X4H607_9BURK|nr:glycosyltransferase family A protein [Duganella margarita]MYM76017.1 glycosyltransferase [Duganella margarita]
MAIAPPPSLTVDICIATYRRPAQLATLLAALAHHGGASVRCRIIVIDNDAGGSARAAAASAAGATPVLYQIEPCQNIALARNRALALCTADYVAFIDDDEIPHPHWLHALLACARRYQADAVFGPVHALLPPQAPAWLRACYRKPPRRTGSPVVWGGAGNVLLRRAALGPAPWFDPHFGLTGGEDTEFFHRLHLQQRRLVWCEAAAASEPVSPVRRQPGWLRRRAFRSGQVYYRVFVRRYSRGARALWFGGKVVQLVGGLALAPLLRLASYRAFMTLTLRLAGTAGQLSRCLSRRDFEEYHARRYQ